MTESPAFARIDEAGDRLLEPLRRMRATSFIFGAASTVGDFSIVWHVIGFIRAIGSARRFHEALFLSCALGVESLVVQGVGRRVAHHYDRPWCPGEHRDGTLVVIGLSGFDKEAVAAALRG